MLLDHEKRIIETTFNKLSETKKADYEKAYNKIFSGLRLGNAGFKKDIKNFLRDLSAHYKNSNEYRDYLEAKKQKRLVKS